MTPTNRLLRLFEYDRWANTKILDVLTAEQDEKLSLLSHILGAQILWYKRIVGESLSGIDVWPKYSLEECRELIDTRPKKWTALIKEHTDHLDRIISYNNSSGVAYKTMLSDILHHVIIHGQHHRAQIATLLRQADINPPATDFIFYTRD